MLTNLLVFAGILSTLLVSSYGWGRLAARWIYRRPPQSWSFSVALGFALWVFIGGILNAFNISTANAITFIWVLGLLFAVSLTFTFYLTETTPRKQLLAVWQSFSDPISRPNAIGRLLPIISIFLASGFLLTTIVPTFTFNYHDDFFKYFPRIVRMTQTGAVGGTPFDYVGIDSLGAHSFLQAFIVIYLPLQYVNGFDAVICFLLSGLLLNDLGRKVGLHWGVRTLAVLTLTFISPQYVNISALYAGSLMILGLMFSSLLSLEAYETPDPKSGLKAVIPVALFAASLAALKTTFLPFAAVYFVTFFALVLIMQANRKRIWIDATGCAVMVIIILIPWVLHSFMHYAHFFDRAAEITVSGSQHAGAFSRLLGRLTSLFADPNNLYGELRYGGHLVGYHFMVGLLLLIGLLSSYRSILYGNQPQGRCLPVVAAASLAAVFAYISNAYFASSAIVGVRYSTPVLIAVFPAVALLLYQHFNTTAPARDARRRSISIGAKIMVVCLSLVLGMFSHEKARQLIKAVKLGTILGYLDPRGQNWPQHLLYLQRSLSEQSFRDTRVAQQTTEPGETIMAWISTPFYLDFTRNTIFTVASTGQVKGHPEYRFIANTNLFLRFLRGLEIRYVMWEYAGARKSESKAKADIEEALLSLRKRSRVIYTDEKRVVFDIK